MFAVFVLIGCRSEAVEEPLCDGCNVVLVSMDTLRADHVSAYGYPVATTPGVDALARRSVLFEDAISQSAWTRPAHFSMFTGLYPIEHGVVSMSGPGRLPPGVTTLAEVLAARGYATAGFTAGANVSAHFGFDRGFERYETHGKRMVDNLAVTLDWLEQHADERFFLFFHGLDPHRPYISEVEDRRALGLSDAPARGWQRACEAGRPPDDLAPFIGNYDAAIRRGDRALGELLARIDSLGLTDRTIVVFTSDHGEAFFEHGRCFHIYRLDREIVHVPLIIRVPGVEPRRVAGVVPASASVGPTLAALVGAGRMALPGPSLEGVLRGQLPSFDFVVSETSSRWRPGRPFGHVRALTADDHKLVHWLEDDRLELFDTSVDPAEVDPVADASRLARAKAELDGWVQRHPRLAGQEQRSERLPPQLRRELESLGYVD